MVSRFLPQMQTTWPKMSFSTKTGLVLAFDTLHCRDQAIGPVYGSANSAPGFPADEQCDEEHLC